MIVWLLHLTLNIELSGNQIKVFLVLLPTILCSITTNVDPSTLKMLETGKVQFTWKTEDYQFSCRSVLEKYSATKKDFLSFLPNYYCWVPKEEVSALSSRMLI